MLQQDKEEIENALDELNHRFATNDMLPENYVTSKKIQHSLEMELSKVHSQLAENARVRFILAPFVASTNKNRKKLNFVNFHLIHSAWRKLYLEIQNSNESY